MKVGFCAKEITPPLGCYLSGNHKIRVAETVADPLFVRAFAAEEDGLAVILCYDLIGMIQAEALKIRDYVADKLGIDHDRVILTCTHTHTAPNVHSRFYPKTEYLMSSLKDLSLAAAQGAIADLAETKAYFATSQLPGVTFNRRYLMKDGTYKTNPGRRNPDIVGPASPPDETIQLLHFVREGSDNIVLVNFQCHPDVYGSKFGIKISADYPGVVCKTLEDALPGTRSIYYNGACGDLNHVDVNCPVWDKNGGPEHVRHMGLSIAGKVLSMLTKAQPVELGTVKAAQIDVSIPPRVSSEEEIVAAKRDMELYLAGRQDDVPLAPGDKLVLRIYEALGIVMGSENPDGYVMPVTGVAFGDVAFVGLPGEVFSDTGKRIRETAPFPALFFMGLTHGYPDYFPVRAAFEEDGYEKRSCPYGAGCAEAMEEAGMEIARLLREK